MWEKIFEKFEFLEKNFEKNVWEKILKISIFCLNRLGNSKLA